MLAKASEVAEPTERIPLKRLEALKVHGGAPECFDFLSGMEVAPLKRCIVECNVLGMGSTPAGLRRFKDGIEVILAKLPRGVTYSQFTLGCCDKELRLSGGLEGGDEVAAVVFRQDPQERRMFPGHEYLMLWTQALRVLASDITWSSLLREVTTLRLRSADMFLSSKDSTALASHCSSFLQLFVNLTTLVLGNFGPFIQNLLSLPDTFSSPTVIHIYIPGLSVDRKEYHLLANYLYAKSGTDTDFYCDGTNRIDPRLLNILHTSGALEGKEYSFVLMGSRGLQGWGWVHRLPEKSVPEPDHHIC
jgi:hypothetical protein